MRLVQPLERVAESDQIRCLFEIMARAETLDTASGLGTCILLLQLQLRRFHAQAIDLREIAQLSQVMRGNIVFCQREVRVKP